MRKNEGEEMWIGEQNISALEATDMTCKIKLISLNQA